jgi:hypothetical protein
MREVANPLAIELQLTNRLTKASCVKTEMAQIYPGCKCSLCGKEIDLKTSFFASEACADSKHTGLLKHSDAPIHWACLFEWDGAEEFLAQVFRSTRETLLANRYFQLVEDNHEYLLSHNWTFVDIVIAKTGTYLRIPLADWPGPLSCLLSGSDSGSLPADKRELLSGIVSEILTRYPTSQSVLGARGAGKLT